VDGRCPECGFSIPEHLARHEPYWYPRQPLPPMPDPMYEADPRWIGKLILGLYGIVAVPFGTMFALSLLMWGAPFVAERVLAATAIVWAVSLWLLGAPQPGRSDLFPLAWPRRAVRLCGLPVVGAVGLLLWIDFLPDAGGKWLEYGARLHVAAAAVLVPAAVTLVTCIYLRRLVGRIGNPNVRSRVNLIEWVITPALVALPCFVYAAVATPRPIAEITSLLTPILAFLLLGAGPAYEVALLRLAGAFIKARQAAQARRRSGMLASTYPGGHAADRLSSP